MANNSLGRASLQLSTDSTELDKGLKDGLGKIDKFSKQANQKAGGGGGGGAGGMMSGIGGGMAGIAAGIGGFAVGAIGSALGAVFGEFADWKNRINDVFAQVADQKKHADKFQISVSQFQNIMAGSRMDADTLDQTLVHMQRSIGGLSSGSSEATRAFRGLGISMQDMRGLNIEEQYQLIGDRIRELPDATAQTTAAMQIFGRSGTETLAGINSGYAQNAQRARDLGLVMSEEDTNNITRMNSTWKQAGQVIQGLFNQLAGAVAPLGEALGSMIGGIRQAFAPVIRFIIALFHDIAVVIRAMWQAAQPYLERLRDTMQSAFGGLTNGTMIDSVVEVGKAITDTMATVIEVLAAVGVAFIDYVTLPILNAIINVMLPASRSMALMFVDFKDIFIGVGIMFIRGLVQPILNGIASLIERIVDMLDRVRDLPGVGTLIGRGADALTNVAGGLRGFGDNTIRFLDGMRGGARQVNEFYNGVERGLRGYRGFVETVRNGLAEVSFNRQDMNDFWDDVGRRARQVTQGIRAGNQALFDPASVAQFDVNPMLDFQNRIATLSAARGQMSGEVYGRAMEAAFSTAEQALQIKPIQQAQAMLAGSSQAQNIVYQARFGQTDSNDPQERMQRLLAANNAINQRTADTSRDMFNWFQTRGGLGVI